MNGYAKQHERNDRKKERLELGRVDLMGTASKGRDVRMFL